MDTAREMAEGIIIRTMADKAKEATVEIILVMVVIRPGKITKQIEGTIEGGMTTGTALEGTKEWLTEVEINRRIGRGRTAGNLREAGEGAAGEEEEVGEEERVGEEEGVGGVDRIVQRDRTKVLWKTLRATKKDSAIQTAMKMGEGV